MSIKALQTTLKAERLYAGRIDGIVGPLTLAGLVQHRQNGKIWWPRQADVAKIFGPAAGPRATAGRCTPPIPLRLSWDLGTTVSRFSCHADVAVPLNNIYAEAVQHYGEKRFKALGLDVFGGCYSDRTMRGSSATSMHAYGIAVDVDPIRNQLKWKRDKAVLAGSDYAAWWRIVESQGAVSLGRTKDFDWMHFQFARLS